VRNNKHQKFNIVLNTTVLKLMSYTSLEIYENVIFWERIDKELKCASNVSERPKQSNTTDVKSKEALHWINVQCHKGQNAECDQCKWPHINERNDQTHKDTSKVHDQGSNWLS